MANTGTQIAFIDGTILSQSSFLEKSLIEQIITKILSEKKGNKIPYKWRKRMQQLFAF